MIGLCFERMQDDEGGHNGQSIWRRYFQHAHFIPIVGVGKRDEYYMVHGDLQRQHLFGTS